MTMTTMNTSHCSCGAGPYSILGLSQHLARHCTKADDVIELDEVVDSLGDDDDIGIKRRRLDKRLQNQ